MIHKQPFDLGGWSRTMRNGGWRVSNKFPQNFVPPKTVPKHFCTTPQKEMFHTPSPPKKNIYKRKNITVIAESNHLSPTI